MLYVQYARWPYERGMCNQLKDGVIEGCRLLKNLLTVKQMTEASI